MNRVGCKGFVAFFLQTGVDQYRADESRFPYMENEIKDCKRCFCCNVDHFVSLWDGCYVVSYPGNKTTGFFRTMPIQGPLLHRSSSHGDAKGCI